MSLGTAVLILMRIPRIIRPSSWGYACAPYSLARKYPSRLFPCSHSIWLTWIRGWILHIYFNLVKNETDVIITQRDWKGSFEESVVSLYRPLPSSIYRREQNKSEGVLKGAKHPKIFTKWIFFSASLLNLHLDVDLFFDTISKFSNQEDNWNMMNG